MAARIPSPWRVEDVDLEFRTCADGNSGALSLLCVIMKTSAIIEGLSILEKYRDNEDGHNCGAEHDVLYAYSTDRPVEGDDLNRLIELGWFQEGVDHGNDDETGGDFAVKHYDPDELWACYT